MDYGIDGSVELVDLADRVSGIRFFVQLKATDEQRLDRALRLPLSRDAAEYYASLDLPILLVRYHAPSKALFVRWFHDCDPYYGRRGKRTLSFRLNEHDRWTDHTPQRLERDLLGWRWLRAPRIALPIVLTLDIGASLGTSVTASEVVSELNRAGESIKDILVVSELPLPGAHGKVVIGSAEIVAHLPAGKRSTIHIHKGLPDEYTGRRAAADILLNVALALNVAGHPQHASRIALAVVGDSTLIRSPDVMHRVSTMLYVAGLPADAIRLSTSLVATGTEIQDAELLVHPTFLFTERLPRGQLTEVVEALEGWLAQVRQHGQPKDFARAAYNVGRYIGFHLRRADVSIRYFRQAARHDPNYLKRHYFWSEAAGLLFDAGHLRFSASFYRRALTLGAPASCHARLADAFLFAGEFNEAATEFAVYEASASDLEPHWLLKSEVLPDIRSAAGTESQRRDQQRALSELGKADALPKKDPKADLAYRRALEADALAAVPWFNLGISASRGNDYCSAFRLFLVAALITRRDVEAWGNVILCAIKCPDERTKVLGGLAFLVAVRVHGAELYRHMKDVIEAQSPDRAPVFAAEFRNLVASVPAEEVERELRFLSDAGEVEVVRLSAQLTDTTESRDRIRTKRSTRRAKR